VKKRWLALLFLAALLLLGPAGCGSFMAHRMIQAPNTYPTWFAPEAPVLLSFQPNFMTNFPRRYVTVGTPPARLCYRLIEPADYGFTMATTNWTEHDFQRTEFDFRAHLPAPTNAWTAHPRGTVVLLHGYALAQFSMMPWALRLAQDGWRCILVDLRGHGKSTGRKIYYGLEEVHDLSQLLDHLAQTNELTGPVAAVGESYGAALALRWKTVEPRVQLVVAMAPYASLSNSVLNLRASYANWVPRAFIRAGLRHLPAVLGTTAAELDTTAPLSRSPVKALFITADNDDIAPTNEVVALRALAAPGSPLITVTNCTHETVTYRFGELAGPILQWLSEGGQKRIATSATNPTAPDASAE
jgi:pimeloyl-ACP methyl ester carboxylesterase